MRTKNLVVKNQNTVWITNQIGQIGQIMSNVVKNTKKPALSIEAQSLIVHQMLVFQKKKKRKKTFWK